MPHTSRLASLLVFFLLVGAGCQQAGRYNATRPRSTRPSVAITSARAPETPPDDVWMDPRTTEMDAVVPIVFVHEASNREAWNKLQHFWTEDKPSPAEAAALLALWPPGVGLLQAPERVVKIKVPLGLGDPTPLIPAANPPTRGKWELGKQLFFDKDILLQPSTAVSKLSCASCHDPAHGYTDKRLWPAGGDFNTPTLINSLYNRYQFWDGRATSLEEVLQRTAKEDDNPVKRHNWTGVVERLRGHREYDQRFRKVFGTPPTQDAVGKALATYLRTVLVGNSLYDRAVQRLKARDGHALEAADFVKELDDAAIKFLLEPDTPLPKPEVAQALHRGYTLFTGRDQAGCVRCHDGPTFSDNGFHNLGIGDSAGRQWPGKETGRFAVVAPGLKDRRQIGAYKTPTLRALPRTGPYFHDGSRAELFEVVAWHVGKAPGPFLDPEIRNRDLKEDAVRALVLFLRALDGDPVADIVSNPENK